MICATSAAGAFFNLKKRTSRDRVRLGGVPVVDQPFDLLEVGLRGLDVDGIVVRGVGDAELVLGERLARIARVPVLLDLLGDDLRGGVLEAERLREDVRVVRPIDAADLAHDVREAALRRGDEDGVIARQCEEVDAAVLLLLAESAEPAAEWELAERLPAGLGEVVAARPGDENAREERRQEVGDDVAILVFETDDLQARDRVLVDLLEPLDEFEDELQVGGVGGADDDGVETGNRDGGHGPARRECILRRLKRQDRPGLLGRGHWRLIAARLYDGAEPVLDRIGEAVSVGLRALVLGVVDRALRGRSRRPRSKGHPCPGSQNLRGPPFRR